MKRRFGLARSSSAAFVIQKETILSCFYSSLQSLAGKGPKPCHVTCGAEFVSCLDDLLSGRFFLSTIWCVENLLLGCLHLGAFILFRVNSLSSLEVTILLLIISTRMGIFTIQRDN